MVTFFVDTALAIRSRYTSGPVNVAKQEEQRAGAKGEIPYLLTPELYTQTFRPERLFWNPD